MGHKKWKLNIPYLAFLIFLECSIILLTIVSVDLTAVTDRIEKPNGEFVIADVDFLPSVAEVGLQRFS